MAAALGNQYAARAKVWRAAIERALDRRHARGGKAIDDLAEALLDKCAEGDMAAIKELGDRLDGKPAQVIAGDPEGVPVKVEIGWKQSA